MLGSNLLSNHFIEASAGTGKTYTIEHLVAKLVKEQGLKLDEILVVTFTRAATFELKERIRLQVESLEDEKIFTIHSFCFQTLREHAFESGISLDQVEENASNAILKQVVKDHLRTSSMHPKQLDILLRKHQNNFDSLVSSLLHIAQKRIPIETTPLSPLPEFDPTLLYDDLVALAPLYGKMCNRQKQIKPDILDGFKRFVDGDLYDTPLLLMTPKNRLKNPLEPFLHYPNLLPKLVQSVRSVSDPRILFANLAEQIRIKIEAVIEKNELIFFEDLIRLMEKCVKQDEFATKVRAQYKAVLIDEFQDTDASQWTIFKTLFLGYTPLYLVGDPKQAIYRFRGADLYTYMEAKKELGNVTILERNFRSTPALLKELNHLFLQTTFALPRTGEKLTYTPVSAGSDQPNLNPPLLLLKAKDEQELFEKVIEQIDLNLQTAVLVKDRYQAMRFRQMCPFPTILAKGRLIQSNAYVLLAQLLSAVLDPHNRNSIKLVTQGVLSELQEENFLTYHHLLQAKGILALFKTVISHGGMRLIQVGGEELYLDMLQLVEILDDTTLPVESYHTHLREIEADEVKAHACHKKDAISIMTIHASKGLEFDVVFPIGLALTKTRKEGLVYSFEKQMLTGPDELYEQEIDAELVRQIYVSFTRAKKRLYIPLIEGKRSPIATFLEGHNMTEAMPKPLELFKKQSEALIPPKPFHINFPSAPIESFSSLVDYVPTSKQATDTIPAGAEVGTLLHNILERIDFAHINISMITAMVQNSILHDHLPWVIEMVKKVASAPLPASFSLSEVDPKKMIREFEFLYKGENGYMKGFIDLFFEHNEHYYIIDWKSNLIVDSVQQEMERHHYHLQASIYRTAIEKYTQHLCPKPIDGIYYIFLRELATGQGICSLDRLCCKSL